MQVQEAHDDDSMIGLVAIGFSPAERLTAVLRHVGWRHRILADTERVLYRRLGIGRAPLWRVYSPGTVATYARAALHGRRPARPVEDTRQLGADAVLTDGVVRALWRPRSPDDRPDAGEVLQASRKLAGGR